jgi:prepilin-type N-terminal cleavage/methylation domain-containing protein
VLESAVAASALPAHPELTKSDKQIDARRHPSEKNFREAERVLNRDPGQQKQRVFTLVELLVVIGIIAVLAALRLPVMAGSKKKARQAACVSSLWQLGLARQMYGKRQRTAALQDASRERLRIRLSYGSRCWGHCCARSVPACYARLHYADDTECQRCVEHVCQLCRETFHSTALPYGDFLPVVLD